MPSSGHLEEKSRRAGEREYEEETRSGKWELENSGTREDPRHKPPPFPPRDVEGQGGGNRSSRPSETFREHLLVPAVGLGHPRPRSINSGVLLPSPAGVLERTTTISIRFPGSRRHGGPVRVVAPRLGRRSRPCRTYQRGGERRRSRLRARTPFVEGSSRGLPVPRGLRQHCRRSGVHPEGTPWALAAGSGF